MINFTKTKSFRLMSLAKNLDMYEKYKKIIKYKSVMTKVFV